VSQYDTPETLHRRTWRNC